MRFGTSYCPVSKNGCWISNVNVVDSAALWSLQFTNVLVVRPLRDTKFFRVKFAKRSTTMEYYGSGTDNVTHPLTI
jgi:hypothetical protein